MNISGIGYMDNRDDKSCQILPSILPEITINVTDKDYYIYGPILEERRKLKNEEI